MRQLTRKPYILKQKRFLSAESAYRILNSEIFDCFHYGYKRTTVIVDACIWVAGKHEQGMTERPLKTNGNHEMVQLKKKATYQDWYVLYELLKQISKTSTS